MGVTHFSYTFTRNRPFKFFGELDSIEALRMEALAKLNKLKVPYIHMYGLCFTLKIDYFPVQ